MIELVKSINPPAYSKKNRGAFFNIIGRIGDTVKEDIGLVSKAFSPLLSSKKNLEEHGVSLGIKQLPYETDKDYRGRVATAGVYLGERGIRGQIYKILEQTVLGRFSFIEAPISSFRLGYSPIGDSMLGAGSFIVIKVRNLLDSEKSFLFGVLDDVLDPDIQIEILPWVNSVLNPVSLDLLLLNGGAKWVRKQLIDIAETEVALLPYDGFSVGRSVLGASLLWGKDEVLLLVYSELEKIKEVEDRLKVLLENISWRVIANE